MRATIVKYLFDIRASYWALPSLMVVLAITLSVFTLTVDAQLSKDWPESLNWINSTQPDGARSLLSTVAGSMITVAGVTFSLTLLVVSHSTSQFGPRLLTNFMRDRGNQITLGTFVSTFIYCLLILRAVRDADEASHGSTTGHAFDAFVPQISLHVALLLAIFSVGVLIYFFHHVPESLRLSNVVANIGRRFVKTLDELFPESLGDKHAEETNGFMASFNKPSNELAYEIRNSHSAGYLQAIDESGLMTVARHDDLLIELLCSPGDFIYEEMPVCRVWSRGTDRDAPFDIEKISQQIQAVFALGNSRTPNQNALFLNDQLVEVAIRALSPGVNDPFSANICIDWLRNAIFQLGNRKDPVTLRIDEYDQVRVVASALTYEKACEAAFGNLIPYAAKDYNVAKHLMGTLASLSQQAQKPERRRVLQSLENHLLEAAGNSDFAEKVMRQLRDGRSSETISHDRLTAASS